MDAEAGGWAVGRVIGPSASSHVVLPEDGWRAIRLSAVRIGA